MTYWLQFIHSYRIKADGVVALVSSTRCYVAVRIFGRIRDELGVWWWRRRCCVDPWWGRYWKKGQNRSRFRCGPPFIQCVQNGLDLGDQVIARSSASSDAIAKPNKQQATIKREEIRTDILSVKKENKNDKQNLTKLLQFFCLPKVSDQLNTTSVSQRLTILQPFHC